MNNFFEKTLTYKQITFRYTRGKSYFPGNEIHPYHEILYYFDGDASFVSANFNTPLTPGSLVILPAENQHRFIIHNQKTYSRFVLNFPHIPEAGIFLDEIMDDIKIIPKPGPPLLNILSRMCDITKGFDSDRIKYHLYANFFTLLSEISLSNPNTYLVGGRRKNSSFMSACLKYINQNYTKDISVEKMAKEMNVSRSTIFRRFNEEFNMPFHRYIQEKRLLEAYTRITEGTNPTTACFESGFNDYSSFYKAYTKKYGHSPSSINRK